MSNRITLEFPAELPGESLRDPDVVEKGKQAVILEMLRKGAISQGRAAELLTIDRHALFDLMVEHRICALEMTQDELKEELTKPLGSTGVGP